MSANITQILQSARPPTDEEVAAIPWMPKLAAKDQQLTRAQIKIGQVNVGDHVCREGKPVRYWLGLVDGLLKVSNERDDGSSITYMGIPAGSWFGEGTALKNEPYRYNVQALRRSTIAAIPVAHFHWLLDHSIEFNKIIIYQLNERVGQFVAGRETDRINSPDIRVARTLVSLFNPILAPAVGNCLRITQQELADVVGLSRQRVNEALALLVQLGIVETTYGGVRVTDMERLRNFNA